MVKYSTLLHSSLCQSQLRHNPLLRPQYRCMHNQRTCGHDKNVNKHSVVISHMASYWYLIKMGVPDVIVILVVATKLHVVEEYMVDSFQYGTNTVRRPYRFLSSCTWHHNNVTCTYCVTTTSHVHNTVHHNISQVLEHITSLQNHNSVARTYYITRTSLVYASIPECKRHWWHSSCSTKNSCMCCSTLRLMSSSAAQTASLDSAGVTLHHDEMNIAPAT